MSLTRIRRGQSPLGVFCCGVSKLSAWMPRTPCPPIVKSLFFSPLNSLGQVSRPTALDTDRFGLGLDSLFRAPNPAFLSISRYEHGQFDGAVSRYLGPGSG